MTSGVLAGYGRVLAVDELPRAASWLVDGLIVDEGLTAIAIAESSTRTAAGVEVVRGLLDAGQGGVLGRRVARAVQSVAVIASSEYVASTYRGATVNDPRVTVAAVAPWDGSDSGYWPALQAWAAGTEVVVIDTAQGLASGNMTLAHARELGGFVPPVVALYVGNANGAGIGGDAGWSGARHRFWLDSKAMQLTSLDTGDSPWPVTVSSVAAVRSAFPAAGERLLDSGQVHRLGLLTRNLARAPYGGTRGAVGCLMTQCWSDVSEICGFQVQREGPLISAIEMHQEAWAAGRAAQPWPAIAAAPGDDDPPF